MFVSTRNKDNVIIPVIELGTGDTLIGGMNSPKHKYAAITFAQKLETPVIVDGEEVLPPVNLILSFKSMNSIQVVQNALDEVRRSFTVIQAKSINDLPSDHWETIEQYLPDYPTRKDVSQNKILFKLAGKPSSLSDEDKKLIEDIDITDVGEILLESTKLLYIEALHYKSLKK